MAHRSYIGLDSAMFTLVHQLFQLSWAQLQNIADSLEKDLPFRSHTGIDKVKQTFSFVEVAKVVYNFARFNYLFQNLQSSPLGILYSQHFQHFLHLVLLNHLVLKHKRLPQWVCDPQQASALRMNSTDHLVAILEAPWGELISSDVDSHENDVIAEDEFAQRFDGSGFVVDVGQVFSGCLGREGHPIEADVGFSESCIVLATDFCNNFCSYALLSPALNERADDFLNALQHHAADLPPFLALKLSPSWLGLDKAIVRPDLQLIAVDVLSIGLNLIVADGTAGAGEWQFDAREFSLQLLEGLVGRVGQDSGYFRDAGVVEGEEVHAGWHELGIDEERRQSCRLPHLLVRLQAHQVQVQQVSNYIFFQQATIPLSMHLHSTYFGATLWPQEVV